MEEEVEECKRRRVVEECRRRRVVAGEQGRRQGDWVRSRPVERGAVRALARWETRHVGGWWRMVEELDVVGYAVARRRSLRSEELTL